MKAAFAEHDQYGSDQLDSETEDIASSAESEDSADELLWMVLEVVLVVVCVRATQNLRQRSRIREH
jgi:hypothetical protein